MRGLALIAILGLASGPAFAEAEKAPMKDADKIVCKAHKDTRSRITSAKVCKTKAEWAQDARDDQKAVTDMSAKTRQRF